VFISHHFPDGIYSTLNYYEKCVPDKSYTDTFGELQLNKIEELLLELKNEDVALRSSAKALFAENTTVSLKHLHPFQWFQVKTLTADISSINVESFKKVGTITAVASCTANHDRVRSIIDGFCYDGFLGNSIFLAGIFLFGVSSPIHVFINSNYSGLYGNIVDGCIERMVCI
jgi:hypothetical protein